MNVLSTIRTLAVLFLIGHSLVAFPFTIEVTAEELQEKISKAMPYEVKRPFLTVVLSEPTLSLGADDSRLHIASTINVIVPGGISKTGRVKLNGPLAYDQTQSAFFLRDPVVDDLVVDKLQDTLLPTIKGLTQTMASHIFAKHPVYVLKEESFKANFAKRFLKRIDIQNAKLVLDFEIF